MAVALGYKAGMRIAIALALLATPALAQDQSDKRTPVEAAREFKLDGLDAPTPDAPADDGATSLADAPADDAPADGAAVEPAPATPDGASDDVATAAPSAAKPAARFNLDTPIGQLIADNRARAILDRDMPGLSTDENLPKFAALSLRKFQPLTGGQLTDEILQKVEIDLAAVAPPARKKVVVGR